MQESSCLSKFIIIDVHLLTQKERKKCALPCDLNVQEKQKQKLKLAWLQVGGVRVLVSRWLKLLLALKSETQWIKDTYHSLIGYS